MNKIKLNILFISSTNRCLPFITLNQANSLVNNGINVSHFFIRENGLVGYLKAIRILRRLINRKKYDIYHAHYSLSGLAATFAGCRPLVVSLMGSDTKMNIFWKSLIKINSYYFWDRVIVKSDEMKSNLNLNNADVIPNGVELQKFTFIKKLIAKKKVGMDESTKYILFISNPARNEKQFPLAQKAVNLLNRSDVELKVIFNTHHDLIPYYLQAAELLLVTSLYEGSPNVIKEAMACNCPIVSTDVGDVKEIIGNTKGCFITSIDPNEVAKKIKTALEFNKRTKGRERIIKLGLDSGTIAKRIITIYNSVPTNSKN